MLVLLQHGARAGGPEHLPVTTHGGSRTWLLVLSWHAKLFCWFWEAEGSAEARPDPKREIPAPARVQLQLPDLKRCEQEVQKRGCDVFQI